MNEELVDENNNIKLFPELLKIGLRRNADYYLKYNENSGKKIARFSKIILQNNYSFSPKLLDEINGKTLFTTKHTARVTWPIKQYLDSHPTMGFKIMMPISDDERMVDLCGHDSKLKFF